jgi:hypothetical protein
MGTPNAMSSSPVLNAPIASPRTEWRDKAAALSRREGRGTHRSGMSVEARFPLCGVGIEALRVRMDSRAAAAWRSWFSLLCCARSTVPPCMWWGWGLPPIPTATATGAKTGGRPVRKSAGGSHRMHISSGVTARAGRRFAEPLLTIVASCRLQGRPPLACPVAVEGRGYSREPPRHRYSRQVRGAERTHVRIVESRAVEVLRQQEYYGLARILSGASSER